MYTGCCEKLRNVLYRVLMDKASGSSLLWAIGALVLLGAVGATVALMSPSALQSKLEQEAGMRAYYNANAGLNYVLGMQYSSQSANISLADFLANMGSGSVVTYDVGGTGSFSFQLGNPVYNGANSSYQIINLLGTAYNSSGGSAYGYVLFGEGKGGYSSGGSNIPYTPGGGDNGDGVKKYVFSGGTVTVSASKEAIVGSVYGRSSVSLAENASVDGDIISNGDVTLGYHVSVTGLICSDGSVSIAESNDISGAINAKYDVKIKNATESGAITAGGNVVLEGSSQRVQGDINAGGDVTIACAANVTGNINAGGTVTVNSAGSVISKNIHAGKNIVLNSKITVVGGLYSGQNMTFADSSASIGLDINAGGKANFSGWDGKYSKNVYAGAGVSMTGKTTVDGNVESGGDISPISGWGSCIKGTAKAKGIIENCTGSSCGDGNCYIGSRYQNQSSVVAPISPEKPANYEACTVEDIPDPPYNSKTTDGALSVTRGKTKTFVGGNYYYSSCDVEGGATLQFDLSGKDINIFCTGSATFGNPTTIKISTDGSSYKSMTSVDQDLAAKIYLESNGDIGLNWKADWFGTLFARGSITFDGGNTFVGSYASQSGAAAVMRGSGYSMTYVLSNYAKANW